jgi:16S rRNA (guanine966-N2)-methyltransferase
VRIVGGQYRGRHIPVRKNFPSRPTTDFAKENIFNVIANHFDFDRLQVLDLFAGTGSISYEFASRGSQVDLIEKDYRSIAFINDTIQKLKISTIQTIKGDVFKAIRYLDKKYDIVFADPPYAMKNIPELPRIIFEQQLLNTDGWFILEHSDQKKFIGNPQLKDTRSYGSVNFSIFA